MFSPSAVSLFTSMSTWYYVWKAKKKEGERERGSMGGREGRSERGGGREGVREGGSRGEREER